METNADFTLNKLLTGLAQQSSSAYTGVLSRWNNKHGWLNDKWAQADSVGFTRKDITDGGTVVDKAIIAQNEAGNQFMIDSAADGASLMDPANYVVPDFSGGTLEGQVVSPEEQGEVARDATLAAFMEGAGAILSARPDHPAIAEMVKPNKDQMTFAAVLALLAPEASGAIAQAMNANMQQAQAQQQRVNDIEFEQEIRALDAELGLLETEFKVTEGNRREDEANKRADAQFDREATIREEANSINRLQKETNRMNYVRQVFRDTMSAIDSIGDKSPAGVRAFLEGQNATLGLESDEIEAIVSDVVTQTDIAKRGAEADIAKTLQDTAGAKAREEETKIRTKFATESYSKRMEELGLDVDTKSVELDILRVAAKYAEDHELQGLANKKAQEANLRDLISKRKAGATVSDELLDFEIGELQDSKKDWDAIEERAKDDLVEAYRVVKAVESSPDSYTDKQRAIANSNLKVAKETVAMAVKQKQEVSTLIRDALKSKQGTEPVTPTISGDIGG